MDVIDVHAVAAWLGIEMEASKEAFCNRLAQWTADPSRLLAASAQMKRWKAAYRADPTLFEDATRLFHEMATMEKEIRALMNTDSKAEQESYRELLFFRPSLQPLNFVPFLLSIWAALRVYVLPGLSLLLPILTLIAPYLILTFVFHIPITFHNYTTMLQSMLAGNLQSVLNPQAAAAPSSPVHLFKQFGIVLMTLLQGIVQPYMTYQHLSSVDRLVVDHGELLQRFAASYQSLESLLEKHGMTLFHCPLPSFSSARDAMARILLQTTYFKMALRYVGSVEVVMRLAHQEEIHPVQWVQKDTPVFRIRDTFDFHVPATQRKTFSVRFDTQRHALLTGPNKGGKSTVLRALSMSALLAHTYGCAVGQLVSTPFDRMFVCLKPDDLPGVTSRFEREIEFTASTLKERGPILVFIDELYHSTNPPDALRSCQIYSRQLWKKPQVISVISTHLFDWVKEADASIQRLCCPAEKDASCGIRFLYRLDPGVCTVSSVDSLLEKNGMRVCVA